MSRFSGASCTRASCSGKPLRPGGLPGHPEGGRWVRRCYSRRAQGSLSSRYSSVGRLCTYWSAWQHWARFVQPADAGLKRSTAVIDAASPICPSLIAKSRPTARTSISLSRASLLVADFRRAGAVVGRPLRSAYATAAERLRSHRADARRPARQSTECSPEEADQSHDAIAIGPGVT